jgi:hypothetical protein
LKTQHTGVVARASFAKVQEPKAPSYLDKLANEIFTLLNDENCNESAEELQLRLAQAANSLVRTAGPTEEEMQAALRALSPDQLDVLLQHLRGTTCEQIAEQQGKTHQEVLDVLTSAYVRLRFSLNWTDEPSEPTTDNGASDEANNNS